MRCFFLILLGTYLYYFKTFSKEFYINDSGAIETQIMETAWVVLNNEGHLPSYLMKAKCDVPDEIFKKLEEGF